MPTVTLPPPRRPAPGRPGPLLQCPACRRVELRPADTLRRVAPGRWPECCGRPMVPAGPPEGRAPDRDEDATPWADRRAGDRRPARAGARIECRPAGAGPDVAIALLDVSPGGLKVAVRGRLQRGDRVRVAVGPPGVPWAYRGHAGVRWWVAGAEGTGLVGLRLLRPLTAADVAALSE